MYHQKTVLSRITPSALGVIPRFTTAPRDIFCLTSCCRPSGLQPSGRQHSVKQNISLGGSDKSGDNSSCRGCYPPNDDDDDDVNTPKVRWLHPAITPKWVLNLCNQHPKRRDKCSVHPLYGGWLQHSSSIWRMISKFGGWFQIELNYHHPTSKKRFFSQIAPIISSTLLTFLPYILGCFYTKNVENINFPSNCAYYMEHFF